MTMTNHGYDDSQNMSLCHNNNSNSSTYSSSSSNSSSTTAASSTSSRGRKQSKEKRITVLVVLLFTCVFILILALTLTLIADVGVGVRVPFVTGTTSTTMNSHVNVGPSTGTVTGIVLTTGTNLKEQADNDIDIDIDNVQTTKNDISYLQEAETTITSTTTTTTVTNTDITYTDVATNVGLTSISTIHTDQHEIETSFQHEDITSTSTSTDKKEQQYEKQEQQQQQQQHKDHEDEHYHQQQQHLEDVNSKVEENSSSFPEFPLLKTEHYDEQYVYLRTTIGTIAILRRPDLSPESVQYIHEIVTYDNGYCTDCYFYRAEEDTLLQGIVQYKATTATTTSTTAGTTDVIIPTTTTVKGKCPHGYEHVINDCPEWDINCSCHGPILIRGAVAWAAGDTGPDFFIVDYSDDPVGAIWLGTQHTVWGQIIDDTSMDVVSSIIALPKYYDPSSDITFLNDSVQFDLSFNHDGDDDDDDDSPSDYHYNEHEHEHELEQDEADEEEEPQPKNDNYIENIFHEEL